MRRFLTPVAAVMAVFLLAALPDVLTIDNDRIVLHLSIFATDITLLRGMEQRFRAGYNNYPKI